MRGAMVESRLGRDFASGGHGQVRAGGSYALDKRWTAQSHHSKPTYGKSNDVRKVKQGPMPLGNEDLEPGCRRGRLEMPRR